MKKIFVPVKSPYVVTFSYAQHIDYAKRNPTIQYNGGVDFVGQHYENNEILIYACDDGIVYKISDQATGYGKAVFVKHVWGYSIYGHLKYINVKTGDPISRDSILGVMGSTGFSTGAHVHFETRGLDNKPFNPEPYLVYRELNPQVAQNVVIPEKADVVVSPSEKEISTPYAEVIASSGANVRETPTRLGNIVKLLEAGTIVKPTGNKQISEEGLVRYEIEFKHKAWIAFEDLYGTRIIKSTDKTW